MPKFETIKAGDVLFDVHRHRMGNTRMTRMGCWKVEVISVDPATRTAVVSWNTNKHETYNERSLSRLKRKEPKREETIFDKARRARS